MCCWKKIWVLKGNGRIEPEPNKTLFLLSDDELLPLMDVRPSNKLMDRSKMEGDSVSTFRWSTVGAHRCASFKEIDGQLKNRRRKCFYFAMMIRCCKQMRVLQTNWWTVREPKGKIFLLCDDDPLLQTDASPSNKLMDRWRTNLENVFTLRWRSVAADRSPSFKDI